jgi:GntR family transcriptional regulator, transcriptional repressor for pyruvate dehydrogenase complex
MDALGSMETELVDRGMLTAPQSATNGALKLSDLVYAKIAAKIRSGEYPVDSRLPTEKELADWLGVSRPVVREALARLRNDGTVVSRRGSGTYVQKVQLVGEHSNPPLASISDMRRCLEFRISLEGEAAWHAANGAQEDRADLIEAINNIVQDSSVSTFNPDHDFAFHLAVATATGNRFFTETLLNMRRSIVTAMEITPAFVALNATERVQQIQNEHRLVFDAIMANECEAARDAMRAHLTQAMGRVFEGV